MAAICAVCRGELGCTCGVEVSALTLEEVLDLIERSERASEAARRASTAAALIARAEANPAERTFLRHRLRFLKS